jgi:hypothetical protein
MGIACHSRIDLILVAHIRDVKVLPQSLRCLAHFFYFHFR